MTVWEDNGRTGEQLTMERRALLKNVALGTLMFTVGGVQVALTPREAKAQGLRPQILTAAEVETLEAVGEALLPGAKAAGLANFVDHQLGVPPAECLLGVRTSDAVVPPYANYYRAVLGAIDASCQKQFGARFAAITDAQKTAYLTALPRSAPGQNPDGWMGPVAPRAAFGTLRGDCLDVVYGTMEGFEKLGIPYMAHIEPKRLW